MLAALLAEPGVEERLELRSERIGFMALHGGNQDRHTEVISALAAEAAGASLYAVVQPPTLRWHLPSYRYDPAESDNLARFLAHVDVVISVHGYGRDAWWFDWVSPRSNWPADRHELWERFWHPRAFLIGGGNRQLAAHTARAIADAGLPYPVVSNLESIPRGARGVHPRNPVNLTAGGGCQVEIPPGPRGLDGETPELEIVAEALARAARTWPARGAPSRSSTDQSLGSTSSS